MNQIEVGDVFKWTGPAHTVVLRIDKIKITPGIATEIDRHNFAVMALVTRWSLNKDEPFGADPHVLNVYLDSLLYWLTGGETPWEVLKGEAAAKYLNYKPAV